MSDHNHSAPSAEQLLPPAEHQPKVEPTPCPCCSRQRYGLSEHHWHIPSLGDLLRELESRKQLALTWHEQLPTCLLPELVWEVYGLDRDQPLPAATLRAMRDRIRQTSGLRIDQVDALPMSDAANLFDERFRGEMHLALAAAYAHAECVWTLAQSPCPPKDHPFAAEKTQENTDRGTVAVALFVAACRRLDAGDDPELGSRRRRAWRLVR